MAVLSSEQVLDGSALDLSFGLTDLFTLSIGGRQVLYAFSRTENTIVEIDIAANGTMSITDAISLSGSYAVGSDPTFGLAQLGGNQVLTLAGMSPTSGQGVSLDGAGGLVQQVAFGNAGTLISPVGFVLLGENALASARAGGGVDLYIDAGSGYVWQTGIADAPDRYLANISATITFGLADVRYIAAASETENGVTLLEISEMGLLGAKSSFGIGEGLPVSAPSSLGLIEGDSDFIVVGSSGSSSLSLLKIAPDGTMRLVDHILDSPTTRFQSVPDMVVGRTGDFAFVAAVGSDGGVSLFTILPTGRLIHLAAFEDNSDTTLYRARAIEMAFSANAIQLFGTSDWESGITRLSYDLSTLGAVLLADSAGAGISGTQLDDQIVGSDVSEVLTGGAGDDIIFDGAGEDTLRGDAGADLFVFMQDGQPDTILDFERGIDKLDLSGFDFLYDVAQLSIVMTPDGATLSFQDESFLIVAADNAPLSAFDFTNASILNADRPPQRDIARDMQGGPASDTLTGAEGDDTISGGGGDDRIFGKGGPDYLFGGHGSDRIDGGGGHDAIEGGDGGDTLVGGAGDDEINGGPGADVIYADDFDWGTVA